MFTYNDIVRVASDAPSEKRPGQRAWVIAVFPEGHRLREALDPLPTGTVYSVEFEGGDAIEVHESHLELDAN
jgi:hypothetical protein